MEEVIEALKEVRATVLKSDDEALLAALKGVEEAISSDSGFMVGGAASLADAWAFIATQDIPPAMLEDMPKLKAVVDKVHSPRSSPLVPPLLFLLQCSRRTLTLPPRIAPA